MKKIFPVLFICSVFFLFFNCKDDDVSRGGNETMCKIKVSGEIRDQLTDELLDSVQVSLQPRFFIGQQNSPDAEFAYGFSMLGEYSIDISCIPDGWSYILNFSGNRNSYYSKHLSANLSMEDLERDVWLCPVAFISINLEQQTSADSIVFNFMGNHCDMPTDIVNFYTSRNYFSDTTEVMKMPFSNDLNFRLQSFAQGVLQVDTNINFTTTPLDTTEIIVPF